MNPNNNTITFSALLSRFQNSWLRDSTNLTWTAGEMTECLQTALDDASSFFVDYDTSLQTVALQSTYSVPSKFVRLLGISIDAAGDGYYTPIDHSAYRVVNGKIIFSRFYKNLPGGKTLMLTGVNQLTQTSAIPETFVPYLLHVATAEAFELLKTSLTSRFLKNDMTMSEIINSITTHRQRAAELKRGLANRAALEA